jgi:TP53 regulating kinase and related kinases
MNLVSIMQFGDKLEAELRDYEQLKKIGIAIPTLIAVDIKGERIVKEYIEGETIDEYVNQGKMQIDYIHQVEHMAKILKDWHLNIDYYPTNFVVANEKLFYIDYECNEYMEEWNFENWGKQYWT